MKPTLIPVNRLRVADVHVGNFVHAAVNNDVVGNVNANEWGDEDAQRPNYSDKSSWIIDQIPWANGKSNHDENEAAPTGTDPLGEDRCEIHTRAYCI